MISYYILDFEIKFSTEKWCPSFSNIRTKKEFLEKVFPMAKNPQISLKNLREITATCVKLRYKSAKKVSNLILRAYIGKLKIINCIRNVKGTISHYAGSLKPASRKNNTTSFFLARYVYDTYGP